MRGKTEPQTSMLMLMSPEELVPADHPIRGVKKLADEALRELSPLFDEVYADGGRPSVPPERLLKAQLLIALYSVRSDRQFCEQLRYNLLFKWFLDMTMDEAAFDASTFSQNRARLIAHDVGKHFLAAVVTQAKKRRLMSADHFSVDGTLIEAWASLKSFRPKDEDDDDRGDGNGWGNFKGEKRGNDTHESKTDPESKLWRKGRSQEAKLCFSGNALMENRHGLLVDVRVTEMNGYAERASALALVDTNITKQRRVTLGADRAYDTKDFVAQCRARNVTPHVAQNFAGHRSSTIDARTTRSWGYVASQRVRKRVESIFGWMKAAGRIRKTRFRGVARTQLAAYFVGAAYNLLRIANLLATPQPA
jgi:transposase